MEALKVDVQMRVVVVVRRTMRTRKGDIWKETIHPAGAI